jgi:hypothetical protein
MLTMKGQHITIQAFSTGKLCICTVQDTVVLVDWSRIGKMEEDCDIVQRKIIPITIDGNTRQLLSIFPLDGDFGKGKLWSVSCMQM